MSAARIQRAWRRYRTIESRSFCQFGSDAVKLVQRFISGRDADSLDSEELSTARAHLFLNFDVNKTILMSDAAKGAGQADMINMLISECAWGRMTLGPTWVPVGRLATDRPEGDPRALPNPPPCHNPRSHSYPVPACLGISRCGTAACAALEIERAASVGTASAAGCFLVCVSDCRGHCGASLLCRRRGGGLLLGLR